MTNSFKMAEMVNQANYAAMSYNELVTLNFAFLLAVGAIKPLMMKKRAEEMDAHTDEFVAKMNNYGASKAEIMNCLEKKAMRETPYGTSDYRDVDDQTPKEEKDNQDKGEDVLALPEHCQPTAEDNADATPTETPASEGQNNDVVLNIGQEGATSNEEDITIQDTSTSIDDTNTAETIPTPTLVEAVIEIAKRGRIPDEINVNAPYYLFYTIRQDADGTLWRYSKSGRNLDAKDLESFRAAHKTHVELFRKKEVMMSTDDCLVYRNDKNTIRVTFYHFTEQGNDGIESPASKVESYSNQIPYYATVDLHKTHRRMRRAIEKAKEYSASVGSSSSPYYDRYTFYDNNVSTELLKNQRVIEDEDTLTEIKNAFETFARFRSVGTVILSEDNCVAVKENSNIYVLLFNFPSQEKKRVPAKKRRRSVKDVKPLTKEVKEKSDSADVIDTSVTEESNLVTNNLPASSVSPLIIKAVEMTKALPAGNGTDVSASYFTQCDWTVTGDGGLIAGRTFSGNVESFEKIRTIHQKCAKTFKSSQVSFTDDYTAYIWNEGKNLSVFYYNRGKSEAA